MFSRVDFWIWVLVQIYMIWIDVFCQYGLLILTLSARLLVGLYHFRLCANVISYKQDQGERTLIKFL